MLSKAAFEAPETFTGLRFTRFEATELILKRRSLDKRIARVACMMAQTLPRIIVSNALAL